MPKQPMKPGTLQALKRSIAHWNRLYIGKRRRGSNGELEDAGGDHCALCKRFDYSPGSKLCTREDGEECPVKIRTGQSCCSQTPWRAASRAVDRRYYMRDRSAKNKAAIKKELDFLKSLLPKEPE